MRPEEPSRASLVYCWDARLRRRCRSVEPGEPGLAELTGAMRYVLDAHDGVGLAAPQVGDGRRVILIRRPSDPPERALVLCNPVPAEVGEEHSWFEEGCLSFPDVYRPVRRPRRIAVRYSDLEGRERILEDDGILARIVQHEIDHLDGVLFIDHLSRWTRFGVRARMVLHRLGLRP